GCTLPDIPGRQRICCPAGRIGRSVPTDGGIPEAQSGQQGSFGPGQCGQPQGKYRAMDDLWPWVSGWLYRIVDPLRVSDDPPDGLLLYQTVLTTVQGTGECRVLRLLYRIDLFSAEPALPPVRFGGLPEPEHHLHQYLAQCVLLRHLCRLRLFLFWLLRTAPSHFLVQ